MNEKQVKLKDNNWYDVKQIFNNDWVIIKRNDRIDCVHIKDVKQMRLKQ